MGTIQAEINLEIDGYIFKAQLRKQKRIMWDLMTSQKVSVIFRKNLVFERTSLTAITPYKSMFSCGLVYIF